MKKNKKLCDNESIFEDFKNIDFSKESNNKKKNLNKLLNQMDNLMEMDNMKMNKTLKPKYALATSLAIVLTFSTVAYGQDAVKFVKETFLGNHAKYYAGETGLPEEIVGKVFDKDGNKLEKMSSDSELYNELGQRVYVFYDNENDNFLLIDDEETYSQRIAERKEKYENSIDDIYSYVANFEEAENYFTYGIIEPTYITDGYEFEKIGFYKNEDGIVEKGIKYMTIFYSSNTDESITINLRYMDEETAFAASGSELKELDINGYKAVITGKNLDILIGDVMYTLNCQDISKMDELILMAESLTK